MKFLNNTEVKNFDVRVDWAQAGWGGTGCSVDPESGSPRTIANEDSEIDRFQRASVPIGPGASDSVHPTDECNDVPLVETSKSKSGYVCEAA